MVGTNKWVKYPRVRVKNKTRQKCIDYIKAHFGASNWTARHAQIAKLLFVLLVSLGQWVFLLIKLVLCSSCCHEKHV